MGRKSSIAALQADVREAADAAIREGRATIEQIVETIRSMGGTVSRSAVGRYKQDVEKQLAHYREVQEMGAAFAAQLGDRARTESGQLLIEMSKTLAFRGFRRLSEAEDFETSDVARMLKAVKDITAAERTVDQVRADAKAELRAEMAEKAKAAEAAIVAEQKRGGLSDDAAARIRDVMLGMVS